MPLTQLDPKSALIVIDLQKGIVALPTAHPSAEITAKSSALARAFRAHGLPVILVNVAGGAPGRGGAPVGLPCARQPRRFSSIALPLLTGCQGAFSMDREGELIVIDDGSTDETSAYLESVRDAVPVPVTVMARA